MQFIGVVWGVGILLYLAKHTRPDIANAATELSKVLDYPNLCWIRGALRTRWLLLI